MRYLDRPVEPTVTTSKLQCPWCLSTDEDHDTLACGEKFYGPDGNNPLAEIQYVNGETEDEQARRLR